MLIIYIVGNHIQIRNPAFGSNPYGTPRNLTETHFFKSLPKDKALLYFFNKQAAQEYCLQHVTRDDITGWISKCQAVFTVQINNFALEQQLMTLKESADAKKLSQALEITLVKITDILSADIIQGTVDQFRPMNLNTGFKAKCKLYQNLLPVPSQNDSKFDYKSTIPLFTQYREGGWKRHHKTECSDLETVITSGCYLTIIGKIHALLTTMTKKDGDFYAMLVVTINYLEQQDLISGALKAAFTQIASLPLPVIDIITEYSEIHTKSLTP